MRTDDAASLVVVGGCDTKAGEGELMDRWSLWSFDVNLT